MPGLPGSFVSDFATPGKPGIGSAKLLSSTADFFPVSRDDIGPTDIRKTRFGLRHALGCELVTLTGRTLSQSARTAHPFELLFACSISGTTGSLQSLFPVRLARRFRLAPSAPVTWLLFGLIVTLAHNNEVSVRSADSLPCRIFKKTLSVSLGVFPREVNSRSLHAFRLKNLSAFAGSFSQAEAVKPQPTFSLPGNSDIERLSPSKFLAPSAQSFEPRFQCKPAGFRNPAVIRRLIPCTR